MTICRNRGRSQNAFVLPEIRKTHEKAAIAAEQNLEGLVPFPTNFDRQDNEL